jgi:hypothetical protein
MTDLVLHHLARSYTLTPDRAESSYGTPVLVDESAQSYGPNDLVTIRGPDDRVVGVGIAAALVRTAAMRDLSVGVGHPLVERFIAPGARPVDQMIDLAPGALERAPLGRGFFCHPGVRRCPGLYISHSLDTVRAAPSYHF